MLLLFTIFAIPFAMTSAAPPLSWATAQRTYKCQSQSSTFKNEADRWEILDPSSQNIPATQSEFRPPPPHVPAFYDIFVGISNYRDSYRCGFALYTAFSRAKHPERVYVGIVDQTNNNRNDTGTIINPLPDTGCLVEYCKRAEAIWGSCKYKDQVRVLAQDAATAVGPTVARWHQQQLIRQEEFCLAIDAHSKFLANWDVVLVEEWKRTNNEMAVLTTYPMGYDWGGPKETVPTELSSWLTGILPRKHIWDTPIISGWKILYGSEHPQMTAFWGGSLSFSKCHAERRAGNDPHMKWLFWGEEYLRGMQLWTRGYDFYAPSRHGHVIFHNRSNDTGRLKFWENSAGKSLALSEEDKTYNRLRMVLKMPFHGKVDGTDVLKYYGGTVRSVEQYLNFSGVSLIDPSLDECLSYQLHWVPYNQPKIIEDLLPGWKMQSTTTDTTSATLQKSILSALERLETELIESKTLKNVSQATPARNDELIVSALERLETQFMELKSRKHAAHETQADNNVAASLESQIWIYMIAFSFVILGMWSYQKSRISYKQIISMDKDIHQMS